MSSEEDNHNANSIADTPPVPPRDHLVNTAAQFLSAPNVQKSPQDMKIAFLKKKGLSDAEIELAFTKCESIIQKRLEQQNKFYQESNLRHSTFLPTWPRQSKWVKLRDITNSIALLAGLAYAIYWFYKKYIVPYLWGKGDRKSTDTRLSEVEKSIAALGKSIDSIKESVEGRGSLGRQIGEVKSEVSSLKKLLLNRKQFPTVSTAPISIPSWQIAASASEEKEEGGTNGSDSSLEMIKE